MSSNASNSRGADDCLDAAGTVQPQETPQESMPAEPAKHSFQKVTNQPRTDKQSEIKNQPASSLGSKEELTALLCPSTASKKALLTQQSLIELIERVLLNLYQEVKQSAVLPLLDILKQMFKKDFVQALVQEIFNPSKNHTCSPEQISACIESYLELSHNPADIGGYDNLCQCISEEINQKVVQTIGATDETDETDAALQVAAEGVKTLALEQITPPQHSNNHCLLPCLTHRDASVYQSRGVDEIDAAVIYAKPLQDFRESIAKLYFQDDLEQAIAGLAEIFKNYYQFLMDKEILQMVTLQELIEQFAADRFAAKSSLKLEQERQNAAQYIKGTQSLGFTSAALKDTPIFAASVNGGDHFARHEAVHLLSCDKGLTEIFKVNGNLNEAFTESVTRLIERQLGIGDPFGAYQRAYPALTLFIEKIMETDEGIKAAVLTVYLKNQGLEALLQAMANTWHQRTVHKKIAKSVYHYPQTKGEPDHAKASQILERQLCYLAGELGGKTTLAEINPMMYNKLTAYLGATFFI